MQRVITDVLDLVDDWGPEKIVCVSDRRTGMRGGALRAPVRP